MPMIELFSAMSQDYLDFYYTSSAIPLLGSGLGPQYKNGPEPQILGPHSLQILIKLSFDFLGVEEKSIFCLSLIYQQFTWFDFWPVSIDSNI